MMPELPSTLEILPIACERYGYGFEILDHYSQHLVEVKKGDLSFVTGAGGLTVYPLNLSTPAQIANDKAHTYTLLQAKGLRIPRGDYFFLRPEKRELRGEGKELADAFEFAQKLGYPVFVKPNRGSHGNFAEVIHHEGELALHLETIAEYSAIALIQEVLHGREYRLFMVDGEVEFAYRRTAPIIRGDGKRTVQELLHEHNAKYHLDEQHRITPASIFLAAKLAETNFTPDIVLEPRVSLQIAAKSNINAGGTISEYTTVVSTACADWSRKVARVMNLRVCGIDLFSTSDLDHPDDFVILEVNRNPSLKGIYQLGEREKTVAIWGKIMAKYFSELEKNGGYF